MAKRVLAAACLFLVIVNVPVFGAGVPARQAGEAGEQELALARERLAGRFAAATPGEWGENVTGVKTRLDTGEKVLALTLDACGGPKGSGFDTELLEYLEREGIPATLFMNARWIDANRETFLKLARNPLFVIANHGYRHRPASVTGRTVYGIKGTGDVGELVDEIGLNALKIRKLTGLQTSFYRSGTAYYDEVAVQVAESLGHSVIGFSVLGDAGATFTASQVRAALTAAAPGEIVILHMNHPGSGTAKGVIAAVPVLRKKGFRFVKLSDYRLR